MKTTRRLALVVVNAVLVVCATSGPASAQSRCAPRQVTPVDLRALDLESLLNVKVITASKFSESQSDAPGIISVVNQDELRRFGGTTLREVLERVPGLASSTAYFTDRSMVAARGDQTKINGGHVLYLINGRPTREVLEGGLVSDLLESFPINVLERIEVIKAPGSVLYGSNAFSAVVNLITLSAETNGFSVGGAPGTDGARQFSGEGTYSCGDLHVVGGAQLHQRPDWNTTYWFNNPIPDDPLAAGVPSVQDATIRDRSRGGFAGVTYKGLSATTSFTEWKTAAFVRGTVGENRWRRGFADVGYGFHATDQWKMNLNATYTRNLFAIEEFPFIQRDSNEMLFEWTNFVNPTPRDQVTFGVLRNQVVGRETYYGLGFPIDISSGDRSGYAGYAQIDHRVVDSVKLIGGFQANKIGGLALDIVPRGGVIWSPATRWNVKALYGQAFRAPSINETTLNHPGLQGDVNLRPESVATFDVELSYHGDRIQGSANYFHSKHTDSIVIDASEVVWRYVNSGEATFQGMEFEGKYYVNRNLYVVGSLLHQFESRRRRRHQYHASAEHKRQGRNQFSERARHHGQRLQQLSGLDEWLLVDPEPGTCVAASAQRARTAGHGCSLQGEPDGRRRDRDQRRQPDERSGVAPRLGSNTGDTIPVRRGRTIYIGVEMSVGRRTTTSRASATN